MIGVVGVNFIEIGVKPPPTDSVLFAVPDPVNCQFSDAPRFNVSLFVYLSLVAVLKYVP